MMVQLRIDLQGCGKVETCSRARVQAMGNGVQLALRVCRQVRALREVLPQQAIGVLIGAALPGAIGIGKEHPHVESLCQARVLGPLVPPIIGQRFSQRSGHMPERSREALSGTRRVGPVHPGQEDQARCPFDQRANRRAIARTLDEIAFPVARYCAGTHVGGAFGHRRHSGDLAAAVCSPRPRPTRVARLTQRGQQLATQGTSWQHIQPRIDGLGRELFPHVVRIRVSEASGNLFRRAALSQMGLDILPQPRVQECAHRRG